MDDIRKISSKKKDNDLNLSQLSALPEENDQGSDLLDLLIDKKSSKKTSEPIDEHSNLVKVPFGKFVQMVVTHDFEQVTNKYQEENIVMSTTLLTELANAHEEPQEERKTPLYFVVGLILGIVVTYLLVKY